MKNILRLTVFWFGLWAMGAVVAQPVSEGAHNRTVRFALQAGLTGGGDTLATAIFSNGDTKKIDAGGLVHLAAGVLWTPHNVPLAMQATIGYHVDEITASNGDMRFSRYPVELMALYTGAGRLRLGAGFRYVNAPRLAIDLDGQAGATIDYKDALGLIAEVGFQFSPQLWLAVRGTFEEYKVDKLNGTNVSFDGKVNGNSFGLYMGVAF